MTLTNLKGYNRILHDDAMLIGGSPAFSTLLTLDASTEKAAIVGYLWHPTIKTGTINIRKIHFNCGAKTLNAASAFRVSLQNILTSAGSLPQPDGTQDQYYDFTTLTANAWNASGNLSADRIVDLSADSAGDTNSRYFAVVFEYQTFTAADSVIVRTLGIGGGGSNLYSGHSCCLLNTSGTYSQTTGNAGIIAFECDDGSFAFLEGCQPVSAVGSVNVANNITARRAGFKFRVPVELQIDRLSLYITHAVNRSGQWVLYDSDGTTVLRSIDFDYRQSANQSRYHTVVFEPVTLAANTYYRWVLIETTANTSTVFYFDVYAAALMDGFILGQDLHWTEYDGSSWTDITTRRPHPGIGICGVHDGTGSGGSPTDFAVFGASASTDFSAHQTSHTINLPASITAGDLLLLWFTIDGSAGNGIDTPSGWTLEESTQVAANGDLGCLFSKTATGGEGSTVTVTTTGTSQSSSAIAMRIENWDAFQTTSESDIASATHLILNPLIPTSGGSGVAIVFLNLTGSRTISDIQDGVSSIVTTTSGSGNNTVAVALHAPLTVSSDLEDIIAWSARQNSASVYSGAMVFVRGAASVGGGGSSRPAHPLISQVIG